jgi:xanthine dehydrogenase FAD-binding subunit
MIQQEFDFIKPSTLLEALKLLNREKICPIAGGTDIVPGLKQNSKRFNNIKKLIDIHHLPELTKIKKIRDKTSIGSATNFSDLISNKQILKDYPLLVKAATTIGSTQIRNLATIGGNFINNAPCADSVPPLLIYDASIKICSSNSEREIKLAEFLIKPYQTQLNPSELVTEIILPRPLSGYLGEFYKLGRRRGVAISRITLAIFVKIKNNIFENIRVAVGAVTPIGTRLYNLESFAKGKRISNDFLINLSQKLAEAILDKTGLRWSSPYKLPTTQRIFYQLLYKLCDIL